MNEVAEKIEEQETQQDLDFERGYLLSIKVTR